MKTLAFAKRNGREILRDPLSLIFCLAFPVVLLLLFRLITAAIGEDALAYTPQFAIEPLSGSISIFSYSFSMLFLALLIARDRSTALLTRLRSTPLPTRGFLIGYALPMVPIMLAQTLITYLLSICFGLAVTPRLLLGIVALIPSMLLFTAFGLLFGALLPEKAVGGIASVVINFAAILGGMFMPLETIGGALLTAAKCFPFFHAIKIATLAVTGNGEGVWLAIGVLAAYTAAACIAAGFAMKRRLRED